MKTLLLIVLVSAAVIARYGPDVSGTTPPGGHAGRDEKAPRPIDVPINAEARVMQEMLRPYLDDAYTPTNGPDQDKAFILEYKAKIKAALPGRLGVTCARKPRVLLLTRGTHGTLHIPGAAGLIVLMRESAQRHKAFELIERYTDEGIDSNELAAFDVVVLNNIGQIGYPPRDDLYNMLLPEYVRNGGGVFGVHGAGLLYMNQPGAGYNVMLGGHVRGAMVHPQQHGSKFKVAVDRPGHLLASAFEGASQKYRLVYSWLDKDVRRKYYVSFDAPAELADELYVLDPSPGGGLEALHGRTPTDGVESPVQLSRGLGTEPAGPPDGSVAGVDKETAGDRYPADVTDLAFALLWTKRDGKGRVAYTQLGHNFAVYSVPCVARMMLESVMYVAGGEKQ